MSPLQVLLIATCTWVAWCPAAAFQSKARGGSGHVSIVPVLPFFPLAAWGLAYWLQTRGLTTGISIVGALHLALLAAMLVSLQRSRRTLRLVRSDDSESGSAGQP
jgi:hypothetical protein